MIRERQTLVSSVFPPNETEIMGSHLPMRSCIAAEVQGFQGFGFRAGRVCQQQTVSEQRGEGSTAPSLEGASQTAPLPGVPS
jgi:hypothetical protein